MRAVSLCRTVNGGPSGVLIREVSLCRTVNGGPSGVLIREVSLCRTVNGGPSGVLIREVSLCRTVNGSPSGVLIREVSVYIQCSSNLFSPPASLNVSATKLLPQIAGDLSHFYCTWILCMASRTT